MLQSHQAGLAAGPVLEARVHPGARRTSTIGLGPFRCHCRCGARGPALGHAKVQAMAWGGSLPPCPALTGASKDPGAWPASPYSVHHQTQMQECVKTASPPKQAGVVLGVRSYPKSSPGCWDLSLHPSVRLSCVKRQLVALSFHALRVLAVPCV